MLENHPTFAGFPKSSRLKNGKMAPHKDIKQHLASHGMKTTAMSKSTLSRCVGTVQKNLHLESAKQYTKVAGYLREYKA